MNTVRTLGRSRSGSLVYATNAEIIENALQQEAEGIEPHYSFYDYKRKEKVTPAGWLVWSLWDGCGIVYRREDGQLIICSGVQSDFVYC